MSFNNINLYFILIFIFSFKFATAQQTNIKICDTISSLKAKNDCIFKVYNQSEKLLSKTYKYLLNSFDRNIRSSKLEKKKKLISLKQFVKDSQIQWLLTRDYNAKTHAGYELTTLQADYAFYKSKANDSFNRVSFLKSLSDSLNIK